MPAEIIEPLELLVFGAIGMTTIALAGASAGELTLSQWRALVIVGRVEHVRVGELASAVGMSRPSASRLVRRLERRGLVSTERAEDDRRATLVRITPGGRILREEVVARRRALMEAALTTGAPKIPKGLVPGLTLIGRAFRDYA